VWFGYLLDHPGISLVETNTVSNTLISGDAASGVSGLVNLKSGIAPLKRIPVKESIYFMAYCAAHSGLAACLFPRVWYSFEITRPEDGQGR